MQDRASFDAIDFHARRARSAQVANQVHHFPFSSASSVVCKRRAWL
jgi:hypothetical protein